MCRFKSGEAVLADGELKVYTLHGEDSHSKIRKRHGIRECSGGLTRYTVPLELIPTTHLCEPTGWMLIFDAEPPDWWTEEMSVVATRRLFAAAQAEISGGCLKRDGHLDLSELRSLPESANLQAGGHLSLCSLTSVPENTNLQAGGHLNLRSLTSVPENVTLRAGGDVYCLGGWTTLKRAIEELSAAGRKRD